MKRNDPPGDLSLFSESSSTFSTMSETSKEVIRRAIRQQAHEKDRPTAEARILALLAADPIISRAACLAAYVAIGSEINLLPLLQQAGKSGQKICFPRFNANRQEYEMALAAPDLASLSVGKLGIPEPATSAARINSCAAELVWLVPGIAFDRFGSRLGRGGGWYDRLLKDAQGVKIGVAFSWQLHTYLPRAPHDIPMNYICTEKGLFSAESGRLEHPATQQIPASENEAEE